MNESDSTVSRLRWVAKTKEVIEWVLIEEEIDLYIVYVLKCSETSRIKIGITKNLDQRIKDIQAMSPTKLYLIAAFTVLNQYVEGFFHRLFFEHRIHGEWFDVPPSKMELIYNLRKEYEDLLAKNPQEREKIFSEVQDIRMKEWLHNAPDF